MDSNYRSDIHVVVSSYNVKIIVDGKITNIIVVKRSLFDLFLTQSRNKFSFLQRPWFSIPASLNLWIRSNNSWRVLPFSHPFFLPCNPCLFLSWLNDVHTAVLVWTYCALSQSLSIIKLLSVSQACIHCDERMKYFWQLTSKKKRGSCVLSHQSLVTGMGGLDM